jgi:organic radical activating enzyme
MTFSCAATKGYIAIEPKGIIKPCCRFKGNTPIERISTSKFNNFEEVLDYYDSAMQKSNDYPTNCFPCMNEDKNGKQSLRYIIENNRNDFVDFEHSGNTVQYLEISLDNTCNMMCLMCNPFCSSKWESYIKNNPEMNQIFNFTQTPNELDKIINLIENSDLSRLYLLRILGGEPLYNKKLIKILEILESKVDLNKVTFTFNTNASIFPNDRILNYFKKFKKVIVYLSIDATEEAAEYCRYGIEWNIIDSVAKKFLNLSNEQSNIELRTSTVIHLASLEHLTKTVAYVKSLTNTNGFTFAYNFPVSVFCLPKLERITITEYFKFDKQSQNINVFMNSETTQYDFKNVIKYFKQIDKITGKTFAEVSPYVWNLLEQKD